MILPEYLDHFRNSKAELRGGDGCNRTQAFLYRFRKRRTYCGPSSESLVTGSLLIAPSGRPRGRQPEKLHSALKSKSDLVTLTDAEGAGEHWHMGAVSRLHQVIFDWLDDTLAARRD